MYPELKDKKLLESLYWQDKLSHQQIANRICCSRSAVGLAFKRHQIESTYLKRKYTPITLTKEVKDYIDGLLLSDGNLDNRAHTPYYRQGFSNGKMEWYFLVREYFEDLGLHCGSYPINKGRDIALYTECHPLFSSFRARWYPNGKKIIPLDLEIAPSLMANWYLGDGKFDKRDDSLSLCTECFPKAQQEALINKLIETIGLGAYLQNHLKDTYRIAIRAADSVKFLDYIRDYFLPCFAFKFELTGYQHTRRKWLSYEDKLLDESYGTVPLAHLDEQLNRSKSSIYHRANQRGLKIYEKI